MTTVELLARAKGGEGVKSGPIGLAVILVLCIAAYFLFKSMSKHLRRVRENFPDEPRTTAGTAPARQPAPTAPDPAPAEQRAQQPADPPPLPPSAPPPPPPAPPAADPRPDAAPDDPA
jgi:hypothetical protein